jgi:hypothetical protein
MSLQIAQVIQLPIAQAIQLQHVPLHVPLAIQIPQATVKPALVVLLQQI